MKVQQIERIAISQIRVVNPRSRNKLAFRTIISNIKAIGLKKPITVCRSKPNKDGTCYELVCGQGRLEAVASLGEKEIPAIITDAPRRERYLMSLVENIARKKPRGSELLREVQRLKQLRYRNSVIAEVLGLGHSYIAGIVHLINCGEGRLVEQVEAGTLPLTIAIKIATAGDKEIQRVLNSAYQKGDLRGAKLRAVERLVSTRSAQSNLRTSPKAALSGPALLKEYEASTARHRALVKRASLVHERLAILTTSMRQLFTDSSFVKLLRGEGLDTAPEQLMLRINTTAEVRS